MYLIHQKQAGKDPPAQLTPDMIPPSMRPKGAEGGAGPNRSVYNNPELEEMAKEIQALLQEKMMLEREVQDQEYQISAKNSETHSLQAMGIFVKNFTSLKIFDLRRSSTLSTRL